MSNNVVNVPEERLFKVKSILFLSLPLRMENHLIMTLPKSTT